MERTGLQQISRGKMFFILTLFPCLRRLSLFHMQKELEKQIIFNSGHPIQELQSVRCGYYCLYFLNEIRKKSFYDVLKVFFLNDPMKNERIYKNIFPLKMETYCVKEKKKTACVEPSGYKTAKNGRKMFWCTCASCGIKKTRFVKGN